MSVSDADSQAHAVRVKPFSLRRASFAYDRGQGRRWICVFDFLKSAVDLAPPDLFYYEHVGLRACHALFFVGNLISQDYQFVFCG